MCIFIYTPYESVMELYGNRNEYRTTQEFSTELQKILP